MGQCRLRGTKHILEKCNEKLRLLRELLVYPTVSSPEVRVLRTPGVVRGTVPSMCGGRPWGQCQRPREDGDLRTAGGGTPTRTETSEGWVREPPEGVRVENKDKVRRHCHFPWQVRRGAPGGDLVRTVVQPRGSRRLLTPPTPDPESRRGGRELERHRGPDWSDLSVGVTGHGAPWH